ncbi:MAG TPA: sigma-E factor negative regulatory protein [Caldimonas sp.]|nr:sigma-E factor negative regulatory protein [Caldimonas sp.]
MWRIGMTMDGFDDSGRERLSALADGEVDSSALAASCAAFQNDGRVRADWHAWHLIGDVLRSEDLASDPRHDRAFYAKVRSRLEAEPVVLAPMPRLSEARAPALSARRRSSRWTAAGAVAAGVVMVVGTFAIVRPDPSLPTARIAQADTQAAMTGPALASATDTDAQPIAIVADSKLIRDAQLERYLEAHQQFAGTSALGVPSAFLRSATVDSAAR